MDQELNKIAEFVKDMVLKIWCIDSIGVQACYDKLGVSVRIEHEDPKIASSLVGREGQNMDALNRLLSVWGRINGAHIRAYVPTEKVF